jgi:hypothetical protein
MFGFPRLVLMQVLVIVSSSGEWRLERMVGVLRLV